MATTLARDAADRCVCRRCEKRCDRCDCPRPVRVYKTSEAVRRFDAKRRKKPDYRAYLTERKREIVADGGCVDCGAPQRPGSSRCEPCLSKIAARQWRRGMVKMILSESEQADDLRVKRCVSRWVAANEVELRGLVAAARPAKVAAAAAARDKWRERLAEIEIDRPDMTAQQRRELSAQLKAAADYRHSQPHR